MSKVLDKVLDNAVTSSDDGATWDFQCPGITNSLCGEPDGRPFHSDGWPTMKIATARGAQHFAEHKGKGSAQSLEEFRREQGLVVNNDGSVSVEDI